MKESGIVDEDQVREEDEEFVENLLTEANGEKDTSMDSLAREVLTELNLESAVGEEDQQQEDGGAAGVANKVDDAAAGQSKRKSK